MTRPLGSSLALCVGTLLIAGCGSGNNSSSSATTTTTVVRTETVTKTPTGLTRTQQFAACIRRLGVKFTKNPPPTEGRQPHVKVPADYIGTAVQKDGSQFDFWMATSPSDAQRAANLLNQALAKKLGVTQAEGAYAVGLTVDALANNGKSGDLSVAKGLDRCANKVSQ